jgi:hypothetical protein
MGLLRFLFGLMGMSNASDQDKEMRKMSEDQFQDELMQQRDRDWDEDMKKDDDV